MALSLPDAPAHGFDVVNRSAGALGGGFVPFSDKGAAASFIAQPQPLYTADVEALEKGLLGSAQLTGWEYVIFTDNSPQAVVELAVNDEAANGLSFAALHSRRSAQQLVRTIAAAEKLAQAKNLSYKLRLLRVPELYLLAVWLSGENDLLLPVPPKTSKLKGRRVFSESALTAALLPLAKTRLNATDRDVLEGTTVPVQESVEREVEWPPE